MIFAETYTNNARACRAELALNAYTKARNVAYTRDFSSELMEELIGDLITDLLHLAASEMQEGSELRRPTDLLKRAQMHYEAEEEEYHCGGGGADSTAATAAVTAAKVTQVRTAEGA